MPDKEENLSHEDRIVWEKVTRTVTAYDGRMPIRAVPESMAELMGQPEPPARKKRVETPGPAAAPPPPKKTNDPSLQSIERPTWRKIKNGRITIDARIDLHGLIRAEAHNLLHSFLVRARERGMRHVLVITGKGRSDGSEGVLRRDVPQWLSKAEFRPLVSGIETSAPGHGGDGALYVRLRRQSDLKRDKG